MLDPTLAVPDGTAAGLMRRKKDEGMWTCV